MNWGKALSAKERSARAMASLRRQAGCCGGDLVRRILEEKDLKVFIDSGSLASPGFCRLEERLFAALRESGGRLFVPVRVVEDLTGLADQEEPLSNRAHAGRAGARSAHGILARRQGEGLVDLRGEPGDDDAGNVFHVQLSRFRLRHPLALITQDMDLARDILGLNEMASQAIGARLVSAYRIEDDGSTTVLRLSGDGRVKEGGEPAAAGKQDAGPGRKAGRDDPPAPGAGRRDRRRTPGLELYGTVFRAGVRQPARTGACSNGKKEFHRTGTC